MPNITPIQTDFSVGEVAPDLQMRSTLEAQRRGVKTMTNFVTDSRGPAIRRSGFRFLGKVGEAADIKECEQSTGYDSGSTQASQNIFAVDYSEPLGFIAISGDGLNDLSRGVLIFRESDGGILYGLSGCTRAGHKIVSSPGTQDRDWIAFLQWTCGGGTRTLYYLDMANSFNVVVGVSMSSLNTRIVGERDGDILIADDSNNTRYWLSTKGTSTITALATPSGWTCVSAASISAVDPGVGVPDTYLACIEDGSQFGFSSYISGTSFGAPGAVLGDIGVGGPGTPSNLLGNPIVVGTSIWWLFLVSENTGNPRTYLVETDYNGSQLRSVPQFDAQTYYNTRTGHNRIQYQASNNSIYYTYQETLWRYSITEDRYYTCEAPIDPFFTAIQDGRSSSFVRVNGFHWGAIINYDAGFKWGYEKIEAGF